MLSIESVGRSAVSKRTVAAAGLATGSSITHFASGLSKLKRVELLSFP